MGTKLFFAFTSFFSIFITTLSRGTPSDIALWCKTTPHPGPCNYFMSHGHQHYAPKHKSEFRKMAVQVAIEQALVAQSHVMQFGPKCVTQHQKAAWADCLKLYHNTILQLNRTLDGIGNHKGCTDFDAQTWLSTSLTNIQTCQSGAVDLNVTDFFKPMVSKNLSELISNGLAVNGFILKKEYDSDGFPTWISRQERKLLLQSSSLIAEANLVVAKDGSGNFSTIQAAIDAAASRSGSGRFIIHVKRGAYRECIEVGIDNNNIMLIGDDMKDTIITGSRSVVGGYTTYSSATAGIDGSGFMAVDITFSNTAGPLKGQAVALRSASDLSVFYRCAIIGYQDTLMVLSQRQFYRNCYIYGTIDFIFGNAAVVFQNCHIYARKPSLGQANVITAQGRTDPYQSTGISIHNSQILAASDLQPVVSAYQTYLGRPWQLYSRTVILKTYIGGLVSPLGWLAWDNSSYGLDTLYYGEYNNSGPGSSTKYRVKWNGFHVITSANVASLFSVNSLIGGQSWLPATSVPFTSGL